MAQNYYVNINTSADSVEGVGSTFSPINYQQFMGVLAAIDETTIDNNFFLQGYRDITLTGTNTVPITADNIWMVSKKNVVIDSWGDEPWRINCVSDFYIESYIDWLQDVKIKNGIIKADPFYFKFSLDDDVNVTFQNCWLIGPFNDSSSYYSGGILSYHNCTLVKFRLQLTNFYTVSFVNTIIHNSETNDFLISNIGQTVFDFDNVASNRQLSVETGFESPSACILSPYNVNIIRTNNYFEEWDSSAAEAGILLSAVSAINTADLFYLNESFANIILATGNTNRNYNYTWYDGQRDGIGALYFPKITFSGTDDISAYHDEFSSNTYTLSGFSFSAAESFPKFYQIDDLSYQTTLNIFYLNYNNRPMPAQGQSSIPYQNYTPYIGSVSVASKNQWYASTPQYFNIYAFDYPLSASMQITNNVGVVKDTFQYGENVILKINDVDDTIGINVSGARMIMTELWALSASTLTRRTTSWNNITPKLITLSNLPRDEYTVVNWVSHKAGATPLFGTSATFTIEDPVMSIQKFVNINSTNDVTNNNTGSQESPLNWNEFYNEIWLSGDGLSGTTYRLKGIRFFDRNDAFFNLSAADKSFTIQDWELSSYGPWVLVPKDNSGQLSANHNIDLSNAVLLNGIIYSENNNSIGGNITVGTCFDTFIVENGTSATITIAKNNGTFTIYEQNQLSGVSNSFVNKAYIAGCTFYAGGGYKEKNTGAFNLYLQDSVISNFAAFGTSPAFTSATVYLQNCVFDKSSVNVSSMFNTIGINSSCQFDWTSPTDYPFTVEGPGYLQSLTWLLINPQILRPFTNINRPPNPGLNSPLYTNYKTGLFGFSRAQYLPT